MSLPSKTESEEFFSQLKRFSRRAIEKCIPTSPTASTNISSWRRAAPKGAILHYTAGANWRNAVRWFCEFKATSAHTVVDHRLDPALAGLADDLPLVKALPATVIQCVDPRHAAWHATWANPLCYGIENRNAGLVKRDAPGAPWRHWPAIRTGAAAWTAPAPKTGQEYVAVSDTTGYEPYSRAQLAANVMLLRYVGGLNEQALDPGWVLPHSAVQTNKFDTGPLFPIHEVRRLACIDTGADPMADLAFVGEAAQTSTDDLDLDPMGVCSDDARRTPDQEAVVAAITELFLMESTKANVPHAFAHVARDQLDRLGFFVPIPSKPSDVDVWLRRALWIFQNGAKLKTTGIPDNETRAMLAKRLSTLSA